MEYIKGTPEGNAYEDGLLEGRIAGMQETITQLEHHLAMLEKRQQQNESKKKKTAALTQPITSMGHQQPQ